MLPHTLVESKIEDLNISLRFLFLITLQCQTSFKKCGICMGYFRLGIMCDLVLIFLYSCLVEIKHDRLMN